jgi:phosphatidyl-myo-inositol dimannoside synthase
MAPQLLLTYDFPPIGGGIARWMAELAKRYPPGTLVVSTGQHPDAPDVDATFPNRVDRLPLPARRLRSLQGILHWSRRAAVLTRQCGVEFIWCGNMKPASYPAKWTMERLGTPFGVLLHGGDLLILQHQVHQSLLKRRTARALLSSAAVLVANSQWTRECCITLLRELEIESADSHVQVVPLGADHVFFRPGVDTAPVRARYGLGEGRWLLSVARLARHKGVDTVLTALSQLRDRYPDLGYAVVGRGEELESLKALAGRLGVGERVRFLTDVPDRDLPALYNCAEVYLGVSRLMEQRVEGFGISLAEASACGIPVVAGRSGGIPEAVRDGETGLLVDAESPEAVGDALELLLGDSALRARLGTAGRRSVESYYNWDRVARDLARIGRELARPAVREAVS